MNFKKIVGNTVIVLAVMLFLMIFALSASAESFGDYEFSVYDGEAWITGYTGSGTDVEIPSEIIGYPVTAIASESFMGCSQLENVTIPDSVVWIGSRAFGGAEISVDFDDPQYEFNAALYDILYQENGPLPEGYGHYTAFDGMFRIVKNNVIKNLTLGKGLQSIHADAFSFCDIENLYIPDVESWCRVTIEGDVFYRYSALYDHPPINPLGVAENIYANGEKLVDLVIPEGVGTVHRFAFSGCSDLKSVTFPKSVKKIEIGAFDGCTGLQRVNITDVSSWCGVQIDMDATDKPYKEYIHWTTPFYYTHDIYLNGKLLTDLIIPEGTEIIEYFSFSGCTSVKRAFIPKSVTQLGYFTLGEGDPVIYYEGTREEWEKLGGANFTEIHFNAGFSDVPADAYYSDSVRWAVMKGITSGTGEGTFSPDSGCTRGQVVTFLWRAAGEPDSRMTFNPFDDVKETDYYYKAVLWAVENGITNGTSTHTFSPDSICTRGQIVTFLWRANGCPEASSDAAAFADVHEDDYFSKAILWAVGENVTKGTSSTTFSPNSTCTRAQIVTFIWRQAGSPAPAATEIPFEDVKADGYYASAVLWAVENGVTSGTSATKFSPNGVCTRGQAVTFLYRTAE